MRKTAWAVVCALALGLVLLSSAALAQENSDRISLELKDAPLQSALTMLFKDTGKSFVLEGGAGGDVNATLNDVAWDNALRAVLDSLNLTYVREGDTYIIRPAATTAPPAPPATGVEAPPPPPPSYAGAPTSEGATYLGIIPVRHASVVDMALWFGGTAVVSRASGGGGMQGYGIGGAGAVGGYGAGGYGQGYGQGAYGGAGGYGQGAYGGAGGYGQGAYGGVGGYGGGVGGYGGGVGGYGGGVGGYGGGVGGYGGGVGGYGGGLGGTLGGF